MVNDCLAPKLPCSAFPGMQNCEERHSVSIMDTRSLLLVCFSFIYPSFRFDRETVIFCGERCIDNTRNGPLWLPNDTFTDETWQVNCLETILEDLAHRTVAGKLQGDLLQVLGNYSGITQTKLVAADTEAGSRFGLTGDLIKKEHAQSRGKVTQAQTAVLEAVRQALRSTLANTTAEFDALPGEARLTAIVTAAVKTLMGQWEPSVCAKFEEDLEAQISWGAMMVQTLRRERQSGFLLAEKSHARELKRCQEEKAQHCCSVQILDKLAEDGRREVAEITGQIAECNDAEVLARRQRVQAAAQEREDFAAKMDQIINLFSQTMEVSIKDNLDRQNQAQKRYGEAHDAFKIAWTEKTIGCLSEQDQDQLEQTAEYKALVAAMEEYGVLMSDLGKVLENLIGNFSRQVDDGYTPTSKEWKLLGYNAAGAGAIVTLQVILLVTGLCCCYRHRLCRKTHTDTRGCEVCALHAEQLKVFKSETVTNLAYVESNYTYKREIAEHELRLSALKLQIEAAEKDLVKLENERLRQQRRSELLPAAAPPPVLLQSQTLPRAAARSSSPTRQPEPLTKREQWDRAQVNLLDYYDTLKRTQPPPKKRTRRRNVSSLSSVSAQSSSASAPPRTCQAILALPPPPPFFLDDDDETPPQQIAAQVHAEPLAAADVAAPTTSSASQQTSTPPPSPPPASARPPPPSASTYKQRFKQKIGWTSKKDPDDSIRESSV